MTMRRVTLALAGALLTISCALSSETLPAPTPSAGLTPSPVRSRPTSTDQPDDRPEPERQAPTRTPTSLPTVAVEERSLGEEGPWLLLLTEGLLYAFNADGTGQTKLFDDHIVTMSLAPDGGSLSYVTDTNLEDESIGLELKLYDLHSRKARVVTALQDPGLIPQPKEGEYSDDGFESMQAIEMGSPRWSNDGGQIAFVGQMDGPSADLYVYTLANGDITRLSDGPSQAYSPRWSPDGAYIFHNGVWNFGTGAGFNNAGSWVSKADGSIMYETTASIGTDSLMRWMSPRSFLLASWSQPCGAGKLRLVNFETATDTMIWEASFEDFAYNPDTGQMVIMVPPEWDNCGPEPQPIGLFLFDGLTAEPALVSGRDYWGVGVDPSDNRSFLLQEWDGRIDRLLPSGEIEHVADTPWAGPDYSAEAGLWAWHRGWGDHVGLWIGPLAEPGPELIFEGPVEDGIWSLDGGAFFFVTGEDGYVHMAEAPDFEPVLISNTIAPGFFSSFLWVEP
jgi:hypothetical protein